MKKELPTTVQDCDELIAIYEKNVRELEYSHPEIIVDLLKSRLTMLMCAESHKIGLETAKSYCADIRSGKYVPVAGEDPLERIQALVTLALSGALRKGS